MPRGLYYILENKKIRPAKNREEFETFLKQKKNVVRQDRVKKFVVSTVFLGIPNPFSGCIFETLVLDRNWKSVYGERHKTYAQAEKGHQQVKTLVESGEIGS